VPIFSLFRNPGWKTEDFAPPPQYPCQHSYPSFKTFHSPDFIATHRSHDQAFTRRRVLTFSVLVSFLLCAFKGSLLTLLDDLFSTLDGVRIPLEITSRNNQPWGRVR